MGAFDTPTFMSIWEPHSFGWCYISRGPTPKDGIYTFDNVLYILQGIIWEEFGFGIRHWAATTYVLEGITFQIRREVD